MTPSRVSHPSKTNKSDKWWRKKGWSSVFQENFSWRHCKTERRWWLKRSSVFSGKIGVTPSLPPRVTSTLVTPLLVHVKPYFYYYYLLAHIRAFDLYRNRWRWMTLNDHWRALSLQWLTFMLFYRPKYRSVSRENNEFFWRRCQESRPRKGSRVYASSERSLLYTEASPRCSQLSVRCELLHCCRHSSTCLMYCLHAVEGGVFHRVTSLGADTVED